MKQVTHLRRSKRGKIFRAGRGFPKKEIRRNYGMAYFENPEERERIQREKDKLRLNVIAPTMKRSAIGNAIEAGRDMGYTKALEDLGLYKRGFGPERLEPRYSKPEARKSFGSIYDDFTEENKDKPLSKESINELIKEGRYYLHNEEDPLLKSSIEKMINKLKKGELKTPRETMSYAEELDKLRIEQENK